MTPDSYLVPVGGDAFFGSGSGDLLRTVDIGEVAFDTREFTIGQGGITLLPLDKEAELPRLPIESYSSVLSRAPTRIGVAFN